MEYFEVIEKRQSVRKYQSRPIESEKLDAILKAANQAPSAGNFQAYEIYVTTKAAMRDAVARTTWDMAWIAKAPLLIIFSHLVPLFWAAKLRVAARYTPA